MKDTDAAERANSIIKYIHDNGKVVFKDGGPMHSDLGMEIEGPVSGWFEAYARAMGNGMSQVQLFVDGTLVYKAEGKYTAWAWGITEIIYTPGEWEAKIPSFKPWEKKR